MDWNQKGQERVQWRAFGEHHDETLKSKKSGEFTDQLINIQHLNKYCALLDYSVLRSSKKNGLNFVTFAN
jgi:hypothetical protein